MADSHNTSECRRKKGAPNRRNVRFVNSADRDDSPDDEYELTTYETNSDEDGGF